MAYRYHSQRTAKRLARRSQKNFIITLIIVALLIYSTIKWILPSFINSIGAVKDIVQPSQKASIVSPQNAALAPPVLNIPYEATNSSQISIAGYGTPNSKVTLYLDDESSQTVDVLSDGAFKFENVSLSLGTNNIYGKTVDEAGKESLPSKTIKLIYLNEKPLLTISEPEDNKKIQGGDKKVKISGQTNPGVKVFINNSQVIVNNNGNFIIDQPINDGDNTITIKVEDSALNFNEIQRTVNYTP